MRGEVWLQAQRPYTVAEWREIQSNRCARGNRARQAIQAFSRWRAIMCERATLLRPNLDCERHCTRIPQVGRLGLTVVMLFLGLILVYLIFRGHLGITFMNVLTSALAR